MTTYKLKEFQGVEMHSFGHSYFIKPIINVYSYFIDGLLIDTAQSLCQDKFLSVFKDKAIEQVVLTHHHEDHSGNLNSIINQNNIKKVFLAEETANIIQKKLPLKIYENYLFGNLEPYIGPFEIIGKTIETNQFSFLTIPTQGHADDHHAFLEQNQGWLFAGDLWVGIKIKYFRKGENFWQQVAAMKQVLQYDFDVIFCGHYPQIKNGKQLMTKKLNYFEDFGGKVQDLNCKGLNISEIISKMNLKESTLARILTQNDVSLHYMIESAITK